MILDIVRAAASLLALGTALALAASAGACRGRDEKARATVGDGGATGTATGAPGTGTGGAPGTGGDVPRPSGAGMIEGTVTLTGAAPEMKPLVRRSDPVCAATDAVEPFVRVGDGAGLADVVIRLPAGAAPPPAAPPPPRHIAQRGCMYNPYVTTAVTGQSLSISNEDRTAHNVAAAAGADPILNKAQPQGSAPIDRTITEPPGTVITLGCDIHPWMRGYVVVTDHAHAAVTDAAGHFRLDNVPAGDHDLEAWHPHLGTMTTRVTVADKRVTRANLTLQASSFRRP